MCANFSNSCRMPSTSMSPVPATWWRGTATTASRDAVLDFVGKLERTSSLRSCAKGASRAGETRSARFAGTRLIAQKLLLRSFTLMPAAALEGLNAAPICDRQHAVGAGGSHGPAAAQAVHRLDKVDPVWRESARRPRRWCGASRSWRASSIRRSCTTTRSRHAVVHRIAERLDHPDVSGELIRQAYADALEDDPATRRRVPRRHRGDDRPRSGCAPLHRSAALLQRLPRDPDASAGALAVEQGPQGFRALPAEPLVGGVPDRHQPERAHRARHLPRSRHRAGGRRDRGDRGRRVDPAWRDARRHRQGGRGPPSEDPPRRADRRRREDPRQYRGRPLRAHRGRLGGAQGGAAQHDRRRRAGAGRREAGCAEPSRAMDQMLYDLGRKVWTPCICARP